ncbi:ankyrin repeat domain-containing protein, partial [Candidatus Dependentiae bacterium]
STKDRIFQIFGGAKKNQPIPQKPTNLAKKIAEKITVKNSLITVGACAGIAAIILALKKLISSYSDDEENPSPTMTGIKKILKTQKQKDKMLFEHCQNENLQGVKKAIEMGANINATKEGHTCVYYNYYYNPLYYTPLDLAMNHWHEEIAEYLISQDAKNYDTKRKGCFLIKACAKKNKKIATYLIETGADISHNDYEALYKACERGDLEIVEFLANHGADISQYNEAFCIACEKGHVKIVEFLLQHGVDAKNNHTALYRACSYGHLPIVKLLVEHGINIHNHQIEPLLKACRQGHLHIVKFLLEEKNVDITKMHYPSSFHSQGNIIETTFSSQKINAYLWQYRDKVLIHAFKNRKWETIENLIAKGANPNLTDENGYTLLDMALQHGAMNITMRLITRNAKVSKDKNKNLLEACKHGYGEIVKYLEKNGADLHATNEHGLSAIDLALNYKNYEIAEYLASKNVKINEDITKYLASILMTDKIKIFKHFEKNGFDITKKLDFSPYVGLSVLDAAFIAIKFTKYSVSRFCKIIKYLVSKNAPIYGNKKAYLFEAAEDYKLNIVTCLIENGANVRAKNKDGQSVLDIALDKNRIKLAEYLIQKEALIYKNPKKYVLRHVFLNPQAHIFNYLIKNGLKTDEKLLKLWNESPNHVKNNKEMTQYLKKLLKNNKEIEEITRTIRKQLPQCSDKELIKKAQMAKDETLSRIIRNEEEGSYNEKILKDLLFENTEQKYLKHKVQNLKNKYLKETKKDVKKLLSLCNDTYTSPYSVQIALQVLAEIYVKFPGIIKKSELKKLYEKIPFNGLFMNKYDLKYARIFAAQENLRDINNLTIDEACILYGKKTEGIEQIISNKFPVTTAWRQTDKDRLMGIIGKKKAIGQNKKFHQNFVYMAYVNCLLNNEYKIGESKKVNMPPEVSSQIASFLDNKSLRKIVMEKK